MTVTKAGDVESAVTNQQLASSSGSTPGVSTTVIEYRPANEAPLLNGTLPHNNSTRMENSPVTGYQSEVQLHGAATIVDMFVHDDGNPVFTPNSRSHTGRLLSAITSAITGRGSRNASTGVATSNKQVNDANALSLRLSKRPPTISVLKRREAQFEKARFSLELMVNILDSYIQSISVGGLLPSRSLRWGENGDLVVNVGRTQRCPSFKGSIEQFLQQRHKDIGGTYRFETDMRPRLKELGMTLHYAALIRYAAPFVTSMELCLEASSGFAKLPVELHLEILEQLPGNDLVRVQRVSHWIGRLSNHILEGNSEGGRQARANIRDFVKREIGKLHFDRNSPEISSEQLEQLIGRYRDIGFSVRQSKWYGTDVAARLDIVLDFLKEQTHLRSLAIDYDVDIANQFASIISTLKTVSSNCKLKELRVSLKKQLASEQVQSLAEVPSLTSVVITSRIDYRTLGTLLANPTIVELDCKIGDANEGSEEWGLVKQALADNKTLKEFDITGLTDEALAVIAPALAKHRSLESLILRSCPCRPHSLQILGEALEHNTKLTSLVIAYSRIDDDGIAAFAPALEKNRTLSSLSLKGNNIQLHGAEALARSLKLNNSLTMINLNSNAIGSEGIDVIAKAALSMKNLEILELNYAGGKGGGALEELRASRPSMKIHVRGGGGI